MLSEETYTIEQFIQMQSTSIINYENLSIKDIDSNGDIYPVYNIINDYLEEILELCKIVVIDDDILFNKYTYKPKLLCYDIYGSQELYFIILALNEMCSVKEFNRRKLKLPSRLAMQQLLTFIYNNEKNNIRRNRTKLGM